MRRTQVLIVAGGAVLAVAGASLRSLGQAPAAAEPVHRWQYAELTITRYPDGDLQATLETPDGTRSEIGNPAKGTPNGRAKLYHELGGRSNLKTMAPFLGLLGRQGWDLIAADEAAERHFIFKREIQ